MTVARLVTRLFDRFIDAVSDALFLVQYGNVAALSREDRREVRQTIKRLRELKRQGVYVMGATNRILAKGSPLKLVLTAGGVTAGSVACAASGVASAGIFGIAESAKDASNVAVVHTEGVWTLPSFVVVTGIAVGDPIYVIPATGVLTQTAAGNRLFAYSLQAAGAGAATLQAKLAGSN